MVRLRGDAEASLGRRWRKRGKVMAEQGDVWLARGCGEVGPDQV